jgi:hypothetical protein
MLTFQYFSCMSIYMPVATYVCCNSIISISLCIYSLVQSFVLACYMPAYMPNIYYVEFYIVACVNLCICYNTRINMTFDMLSSVSIYMPSAMSTTLHRDYCKQITIYYMPAVICQMLCALCQVSYASYHEFTVMSTYMSISVPVAVCSMSNLACQL